MKKQTLTILMLFVFASVSFSQVRPIRDRAVVSHTKKGLTYYQQGKLQLAKKEFFIALKNNKKNLVATEMLALIFYKEKNYKQAHKFAERAIELNPKTGRAFLIAAAILKHEGNHKKAQEKIKRARELGIQQEDRERFKDLLNQIQEQRQDGEGASGVIEQNQTVDVIEVQQDSLQTEKPRIAVFPLEETNVMTEKKIKIGETLSEMLTTALIQTNSFEVLERAQLTKVINEQEISQAGVVDSETAVEVGKLIGMQAVVVGSVSHLKTRVEADVRLIDINTGKALGAVNGNAPNLENMRNLANQLANKLAGMANLISAPAEQVVPSDMDQQQDSDEW